MSIVFRETLFPEVDSLLR